MAGSFFSLFDLLLVCAIWGTSMYCVSFAQQGDCRRVKFLPPEDGKYFEDHVFLNLSIGMYASCEHRCVMESECVSVNVGPLVNSKVVCELSNSDHMQHQEDLKPRHGWAYTGTENLCCSNPCFNNGKCLMGYTDKRYLCVCQAGYAGENCEEDIDECSNGSHGCNENATCINTAGHFNCSCKLGFTGDGRLCSDIDECMTGTHDCHQIANCTNTLGSHNCICKEGFTGDGRHCSDVDECITGSHDCHQNANCTNTVGSHNCTCKEGFSGDGRQQCADIDECMTGSHDCHQIAICSNTVGSHSCTCKEGFTGDGRQCSDIDECITGSHDCHQNANCTNTVGSHNCTCKEGFSGDGRQQCTACVCTGGQAYFAVPNYDGKNNILKDDIQFEFKTSQPSGLIMYAGGDRDSIEVACKDGNVVMFNIDLQVGVKEIHGTGPTLNNNKWHQVHLFRYGDHANMTIDNIPVVVEHKIPGGKSMLDLESSTAYFLGAPANLNLLPNFNGCIRELRVHGYEPVKLARSNYDPNYEISNNGFMTLCNASDE